YKRNLVIPYDEVVNFVVENAHGSVLYVSNDQVEAFLLRGAGYCVIWGDEGEAPPCAEQSLDHFDTIVIAVTSFFARAHIEAVLREIREHRTLRTKASFGYDRWARLKSHLTGTKLDDWAVTVLIYR